MRQAQPEMIAEDQEGENREEKKESLEEPREETAPEGEEAPAEEEPQPEETHDPPEPPDVQVSTPEEEEPAHGGLGDRRDDVPGPMEFPSSVLDPPHGGPSLATSPQPMTSKESKSLDELEPKQERPLHHPHIHGAQSRRQIPLPTPPLPSGDNVPRPPAPLDVASAPAEVGPERKRFTFDEHGQHNIIDGSSCMRRATPLDLPLRLLASGPISIPGWTQCFPLPTGRQLKALRT
ncbi:hypothetical protein CALVIDRAFT_563396 [Calocera viscosa TUFC12733]|uniref:Uncharacterized protein n=1 Tax=Calocera viscosa (strain TUFC12733) TaxID=1330018 RepID=A0A167MZE3_CALVF|nr:hypothetical protein CALVIDRAFT_563396 [Calocera viscosa TUFC12733]